ncbi:hypothetical protein OXIME_000402 [Oxyplasma meridianum]|uniref:Uncharacterized protein n=1 Tax=Oxyplasma meridianum TaxID=3073602 RepID=A0AAX4NFW6_9ARCH
MSINLIQNREIFIPFVTNGTEQSFENPDVFIASESPLYLGIIMKPSKGVWEYLKNSSEMVLCRHNNEKCASFTIPYKIEVGENTIFFIQPESMESLFRSGIMENP